MSAILEVRDLVKHYGKVRAGNGVSFQIAPGTCFGLLGPNGAGKTTTIEMLEGINPPTAGEILYRGKHLGRRFREEATGARGSGRCFGSTSSARRWRRSGFRRRVRSRR